MESKSAASWCSGGCIKNGKTRRGKLLLSTFDVLDSTLIWNLCCVSCVLAVRFSLAGKSVYFIVVDRFARSGPEAGKFRPGFPRLPFSTRFFHFDFWFNPFARRHEPVAALWNLLWYDVVCMHLSSFVATLWDLLLHAYMSFLILFASLCCRKLQGQRLRWKTRRGWLGWPVSTDCVGIIGYSLKHRPSTPRIATWPLIGSTTLAVATVGARSMGS